jgi:bifunctional non-homologous end joining protein LigD
MAKTSAPEKLKEYRRKRDFRKTAEPAGKTAKPRTKKPAEPVFVIHKHDATRLHYDVRLQIGETLASWAVPKGPSLNPADKRLAVHVEDHPFEYRKFEGTIPDDEYGGGTVMIWDFGTVTFKPGRKPREMMESGLLEFELHGQKLTGHWALVHTRMRGDEKNWLLIKRKDPSAQATGDILEEQPNSAATGRSLDEIAAEAKK